MNVSEAMHREIVESCEVPSPARAIRDLRFYAEILCLDKPERYEVYQTAQDGTTVKLSDAITVVLAAFVSHAGADRLAGAVCAMIDRGVLDARSEAADALLDYASAIYGDHRPIDSVRERYQQVVERRAKAGAE